MNWNENPDLPAEVRARLLERLASSTIREVAICKMEGATNEEIAGRIGRSVVTVERLLVAIRCIWQRESMR